MTAYGIFNYGDTIWIGKKEEVRLTGSDPTDISKGRLLIDRETSNHKGVRIDKHPWGGFAVRWKTKEGKTDTSDYAGITVIERWNSKIPRIVLQYYGREWNIL